MTTRTYKASGYVNFAVEADDPEEARAIIEELVHITRNSLPTGVTISLGEEHQSRKIQITAS